MLQFVIAGLVLGGIYAIASAGLVITYTSSGILNFAFGSLAFFIARFYYFLNTQEGWSIVPAAVVAIGIASPVLGIVLYAVLFRHLRLSSPLIKVVATIGLSVAIPSLATLIFGNAAIQQAPGLAPQPVHVFRFLGVPVTLDQVIVYGCVIVTVAVGAVVLRFTDVGLKVRAMVDSPAMTDLSGTNPRAVSIGVWAVSIFFAGLAGVLAAPIIGLDAANFTLLIAATFAAVIAAKLRNLPVAVGVALLMGIATSLIQRYLPPASAWTSEIIDAVPFIVIAVVLIYSLIRRGTIGDNDGWGGALDRAITPQGESRLAGSTTNVVETASLNFFGKYAGPVALIVVVGALPMILGGYWVGLVAQAFAYGVIFLSWTLVTGEGGMLWLCQITFAGVGALTTAQLANHYGWPVLAGVIVGGLVAGVVGAVVGFLSIRLGRPVRRPGDPHLRAPGREPRVHPAELREPGPRPQPQPARLCHLRHRLLLFVSGGLHPGGAVHRQPPEIDDRDGPERGSLERSRSQDIRGQRGADEGAGRGARRPHRRYRGRAAGPGPNHIPTQRIRHLRRNRLVGRAGDDRHPVERRGSDRRAGAGDAAGPPPGLRTELDGQPGSGVLRTRRHRRRQVPRRRVGRTGPPGASTDGAHGPGPPRGTAVRSKASTRVRTRRQPVEAAPLIVEQVS